MPGRFQEQLATSSTLFEVGAAPLRGGRTPRNAIQVYWDLTLRRGGSPGKDETNEFFREDSKLYTVNSVCEHH